MSFLKEIWDYKTRIIGEKLKFQPELAHRASKLDNVPGVFMNALKTPGIGLIAEIKLASPSKGVLTDLTVSQLAEIYSVSNADCISVLTEEKYFNGNLENINKVKSVCKKPVLMKDFIISEYQIYEGALAGADAVLLIARLLDEEKITKFLRLCRELNISAVVEIHSAEEIERVIKLDEIEILGVNSRDLDSLSLDKSLHRELAVRLPKNAVKIAESGIDSIEQISNIYNAGYDAVLIGENIVKSSDPVKKIGQIKQVG